MARPPLESDAEVPRRALLGLPLDEIVAITQRAGFEAYRARQLFQWIYQKNIERFDQPGNLPKPYRDFLEANYAVGLPEIERVLGAPDSTQKLLLALADGRHVECVMMRDDNSGRLALCVSSQVGCALDCKFCLTGAGGFQRQMSSGEIVGQVLAARRLLGNAETLNNMVFMGMGEPLLNLKALLPALRLIISPQAIAFPSRRITVSTAGVVPGIRELGAAGVGVNLAVSLNAVTDEQRSAIMPINKRWPIEELLQACREFPLYNQRRVTFEYVLLEGINDSDADARRLSKLAHGIRCKINLIVFNPHEALPYRPSPEARLDSFRRILTDKNLIVAVRYSKGRELLAACGQLAGHVERFRRT